MNYLPHISLETGDQPNASVIWLHGLGASGHDFESIVPHLALPSDLPIRFIFPHAPEIPVTVNGGYVMPAWYDILKMSAERKINEAQMQQSNDAIVALIEREIARGIPSERIVLAGFSQGGAVAYHCGLSYPKKLAGILALSTYFPTAKTLSFDMANQDTAIHLFHGTLDDMVTEAMGQEALKVLQERGFSTTYTNYPMGHEVCMDEIKDISQRLQALLKYKSQHST